MSANFTTAIVPVNAFKVKMNPQPVKKSKKATVASIDLDGREVFPTDRFWKSLQMRFRLRTTIFKYFTPDEVFDRITKMDKGLVRYTIEETAGKPRLLAIINPNKPIVDADLLDEIIHKPESNLFGAAKYNNGLVSSTHNTLVPWRFNVGSDTYHTQFNLDCPIDGFGKPAIYVSLLREICTNGMVGYAPAFRTELNIGKKDESVAFTLERAVASYSNEALYTALVDRIKSGMTSFCSVAEAMKLHRLLIKVYNEGGTKLKKLVISKDMGTDETDVPIFKKFYECVGDLNSMYGVANMDALSPKKQKMLPTKAKVNDFINFTTEVATHHCYASGQRRLNAFVGQLLSDEFDMEGTADGPNADWRDFYMSSPEANAALASTNNIIQED